MSVRRNFRLLVKCNENVECTKWMKTFSERASLDSCMKSRLTQFSFSVSGIDIYIILVVTCLVCIFYTTVGGLKYLKNNRKSFSSSKSIPNSCFRAVVWTDALQFFMMLAAVLAITIVAGREVDGFSEVWRAADRGKRIIFFE